MLVLRADGRDFPLREYQRWWAFLSGTLLPLYVVRTVRPSRCNSRHCVLYDCYAVQVLCFTGLLLHLLTCCMRA